MTHPEPPDRDRVFLELFLTSDPSELTEDQLGYLREHPEMIDEVTAPVSVHKWFLWWGALLGVACVALSKFLKFDSNPLGLSDGVREFGVDIVFEIGVALIGAAVTAYLLGILLNQQQDNAAHWRAEIRQRIDSTDSEA